MTTEDDFQAALDKDPTDWQTRLVFADWLLERDDPRSDGYRTLAVLRRVPLRNIYESNHYNPSRPAVRCWGYHWDHAALWKHFMEYPYSDPTAAVLKEISEKIGATYTWGNRVYRMSYHCLPDFWYPFADSNFKPTRREGEEFAVERYLGLSAKNKKWLASIRPG